MVRRGRRRLHKSLKNWGRPAALLIDLSLHCLMHNPAMMLPALKAI